MRSCIAPVAVVAILAAVTPAFADSLVENLGPREIALGDASRAEATGGMAVNLNPAGLPLTREVVFEGSFGYRSEDSASLIGVSACDSTVPIPGCFYYKYLSASPEVAGLQLSRRLHEGGVLLARAIAPRVAIGVNGKYFDYNTELDGEASASGFSVDAGASVRASSRIALGVVGYNLAGEDSSQYPLGLGAGLSVRPVPNLGLVFDGVWNFDRPEETAIGRYGGGAEYFVRSSDSLSGYPLRAGLVHDRARESTSLTGGLGLVSAKVALDVSARYQVGGEGDELLVIGSLRIFGPRQEMSSLGGL